MDKPELKEIAEHMNNQEEALLFYSYYESQGWKVGKNPMKSWKGAASGWLTRNKKREVKSKSDIEIVQSNKGETVSDRFWLRMTEAFGLKWTRNYGKEPTKPWIDLLNSLPKEKIAHGLSIMPKRAKVNKWPTDLLEFNELCQSYQPKLKALTHSISREELLAQRTQTEHIRIKSMSEIRSTING